MLTEERIKALEGKGFNRWTKGNLDRLYISAAQLGLVCTYYNTGNISNAEFNGNHISNCSARKMKGAKTFIDIKSERVYSDHETLQSAAERMLEETA